MSWAKFYFSFLLMCFIGGQGSAQISTDGLIAYYPFSNDIVDEGPNSYDGTMVGGQFTTDENGSPNAAIQFDGIDDYVDLSVFATTLRDNLPELTIYFKVLFEEFGDNQTILSLGTDGENLFTNVFEIEYEHNHFQVETEQGSGAINTELEIDQTSNLFTGEWIEIQIYVRGDSLTYCRDKEVIYDGIYVPAETTTQNLFLGGFGGSSNIPCCFFGGKLDELQFYNRRLPKDSCPAIVAESAQTYVICDNSSINVNGIIYDAEGSYDQMLQTSAGCDSIHTVIVEFTNVIAGYETYSGCMGDDYSITIGGQVFDEASSFGTVFLQTAMGCDSMVEVDLLFADCEACGNSIPNLNVQVLRRHNGSYSIYYANGDRKRIIGSVSRKESCDYLMSLAKDYNKTRPKHRAYYLDERQLMNMLGIMRAKSVMKF